MPLISPHSLMWTMFLNFSETLCKEALDMPSMPQPSYREILEPSMPDIPSLGWTSLNLPVIMSTPDLY